MVGRSNEISRENCRIQDADDVPLTEQRGTLLQQWPRPGDEVSLAVGNKRGDIGIEGRCGPTEGRAPIVARKPCSKTRWSQGEQEVDAG
jgi:hypothetical protein